MDASDIGRYGTISLLKRLEPDTVVASYPIDEPEITLGRDTSCSIRLYYPAVSALHCKIIFNENKAFLVVLGTNGVLVDGCPVFPSPAGSPPATVPLPNGSTIDVHRKRFRFAYPPKHLRTAFATLDTPTTQKHTRRALRMSMITSAHVFSPRPSADPRANLIVLQSPLKAPFPRAAERATTEADDEIVLVESDHPRVVEEDKDLVILDHVTVPPPPPPAFPLPMPAPSWPPPQTPRPGRAPRPSLHRAVLLRSAHRAALRQEMQREEEQEVEEVEDSIVGSDDEDGEIKEEEDSGPRETMPVSGWRKSLDLVKGGLGWAFRGSSTEPVEQHEVEQQHEDEYEQQHEDEYERADEEPRNDDEDAYDNEAQDENNNEQDDEVPQLDTPVASPVHARPLGRFMTPQAVRTGGASQARYSMGGSAIGPRRVRVVAPWKVTDLVVPVGGDAEVKEEDADTHPRQTSPERQGTPRRERLSEEERKAIRERRRSALTTPDMFFGGHAPGSRTPRTPAAPLPAAFPMADAKQEGTEEDTQVLLARMRQMVEGVKSRQSMGAPRASLSPRKRSEGFSLLAPDRRAIQDDDAGDRATGSYEELESEGAHGPLVPESRPRPDVPKSSQTGEPRYVASGPSTPQYTGLRNLSKGKEPMRVQATPRMDGVREMFLRERPGEEMEPALEGVGEMLVTPAGWRAREHDSLPVEGRVPEDEPEVDVGEDVPKEEPQLASRTGRGRVAASPGPARRTPRSAPQKETHAAELDTVLEDETAADSGTHVDTKSTKVVRRTRTRTATESDQESAEKTNTNAKPVRGRRAKASEERDTPELVTKIPTQTKVTTRRRAGTEASEDEVAPAPARTVRRTRRGAESPQPVEEVPPTTTKTLRRTRVTRTPVPEEPEPAPPAKPSTARRGKARAASVDVDDDPLDFIPHAEDSAPVPAAKVRRTTRNKAPVKEEEDSPAIPLPAEEENDLPAPRAVRGRKAKTGTSKAAVASGSGAAPKSAARTRASAKKAADTPVEDSADEDSGPGDKENTPEPQEEEQEVEAPARMGKIKATRAARKEPLAETEVAPARSAAGARVARTRAGGRK
ncbi:hypothetical protein B0H21DRAFT_736642 [Amylocystis lapponica]|nr:hypothetical protein B0H21DRAFT_736642 [Amylocystis lapponica]